MRMKLAVITAAIAAFFFSVPVDAGHPLDLLEPTTVAMKPGEWTLLPASTPPWGTVGDKASAAYDFRRHNWYFAAAGGNPLFYNFEGMQWGRRQATAPVIGAQYDGVVWHDGRNSGLWLNGTVASEYAEATGWKTPLPLAPAISSSAPISFYRPKSNSAVVIPIAASQGPFEITTAGAVARRSSTAWKTSGSGVGAYDWIRDQAYIFHSDGSGTTFYVFGSSALASNPLGAPAVAAVQPAELAGAGGIGHTCGMLFVDDYDMLFVWCGGRAIWTYEPRRSTPRWTKYDTGTAIPTSVGAVAVNNRFIYISELRVFAGFTNPAEGVWLYKFLSEPEPEGAVINSCSDIRGPCIEYGGGSLTSWSTLFSGQSPAGTTVVVTAPSTEFTLAMTPGGAGAPTTYAWRKIIGKGRMANAACLALPPKPECDRPRMYQTQANATPNGWLDAGIAGPTTVQHMRLDHIRDQAIIAGAGQYSQHKQVLQIIDTYMSHCAKRCVLVSSKVRADFPNMAYNDELIVDRSQFRKAGTSHTIYDGVTGALVFRRSYSGSGSTGTDDAGHALKAEAANISITDSILSIGEQDPGPDCTGTTDWTNASNHGCYGNSPVLDMHTSSRGVISGNVFLQSSRTRTNPFTAGWTDTGGNIWKTVGDVPWGKEVGQTLSVGTKKRAKNWLAAQGDWYYSPSEYKIYMYSTTNPGSAITMTPPLWTVSGAHLGGIQQIRTTMLGSLQTPPSPWKGMTTVDGSTWPADESPFWGTTPMPDTGHAFWADVAAGGTGTDELEAGNPYFMPLFVSGNKFVCANCTSAGAGIGNLTVWVNNGTMPGAAYYDQGSQQCSPLTYWGWYCSLNPTVVRSGVAGSLIMSCPAMVSGGYALPQADPLPTGWIERSRVYHGANCLTGWPAIDLWKDYVPGQAIAAPTNPPNQWGYGGYSQLGTPTRMRSAAADTCPAGSSTLPAWFITDYRDPRMFWRKNYYGVRSGGYFYQGGSSAH